MRPSDGTAPVDVIAESTDVGDRLGDNHAAGGATGPVWGMRAVLAVLVGGSVVWMFSTSSKEQVGLAALLLMMSLLFLNLPVALVLAVSGIVGLLALRPRAAETVLSTGAYDSIAQWTLSVIPMFVLMGLLLWRSGITEQIYVTARHWLSWLPGGLAVSTNLAGAGLAAVSGSTLATTYTLGRMGIPEMLKAGYDRRIATGSVMVAGLPGQLIPPSTFLVVYAGIAQVPVGPQLLAGVGPGLFVALVFTAAIVVIAIAAPRFVGRGRGSQAGVEHSTWGERWQSLLAVWPLPVLIILVIGGMLSGFLTATEAASAGAAGALLLTIWKQRGKAFTQIKEAAIETVSSVGAIFLLVVGAITITTLLTLCGLTQGFTDWVVSSGMGRIEFLLLILVVYLVLGTFLEPLPMMLLTVPLLIPALNSLDISLLWFGVFAVFMGELAVLTPPVGILSFIVFGITQDKNVNLGQQITLKDIFVALAWLMPFAVVVALGLIFFPEIATYIPDRM